MEISRLTTEICPHVSFFHNYRFSPGMPSPPSLCLARLLPPDGRPKNFKNHCQHMQYYNPRLCAAIQDQIEHGTFTYGQALDKGRRIHFQLLSFQERASPRVIEQNPYEVQTESHQGQSPMISESETLALLVSFGLTYVLGEDRMTMFLTPITSLIEQICLWCTTSTRSMILTNLGVDFRLFHYYVHARARPRFKSPKQQDLVREPLKVMTQHQDNVKAQMRSKTQEKESRSS